MAAEGTAPGSRGSGPRHCRMWVMDARGEKPQKTATRPCRADLPSLYCERKVTSAKQAHNETLNSTAKVPSASAAPAFHRLLLLHVVPAAPGSAGEVQRCHAGDLLGTSQSPL